MTDTRRVLIIYTGGTIGMKLGPRGYAPAPGLLSEQLAAMPQFHDRSMPTLTTPLSRYGKRVHYRILEHETLLDSSNMGIEDWVKIARDIERHYADYDAFIVLHGTDTMAYTASALSFMLEDLGKPVILTGSQIPVTESRNDAVDNVLGALTIAGHYEIPEVCIYFDNKLLRGNRSQKTDAAGFSAFSSGNCPPLVEVGIDIRVAWDLVLPAPPRPLRVRPITNHYVAALRLFPGISAAMIDNVLQPPLEGLVLESFGAGNAPDRSKDFLAALKAGTDRGVVILNVTQCQRGTVTTDYAAGTALAEVGVVGGADMTPEAALTKLSWLLSQDQGRPEVERLLRQNLRGELTLPPSASPRALLRERSFIAAVTRVLAESGDPIADADVERALLPVLLASAASLGDTPTLARLLAHGADVELTDHDGRTALHAAAAAGQRAAVELLLAHGARADRGDVRGRTPLDEARDRGHPSIADLLRRPRP